MSAAKLAEKIAKFLTLHANVSADYDPDFSDEEDLFASPDANILYCAQKLLEQQSFLPKGFIVHSSWESGGYSPYNDAGARALHDEIVKECQQFIK